MKYNKILHLWILVTAFTSYSQQATLPDNEPLQNAYAFTLKNIHGEHVNFEAFKGKVTLMVNVASKCGFTPQYEGLQALHDKYKDLGFRVIAFPCNNFGEEEPGTSIEILKFFPGKLSDNISSDGQGGCPRRKPVANLQVSHNTF